MPETITIGSAEEIIDIKTMTNLGDKMIMTDLGDRIICPETTGTRNHTSKETHIGQESVHLAGR